MTHDSRPAKSPPARIVLCYPVEAAHIAQIRAVSPSSEIVDAGQERIASELSLADVYCGHAKVPVPWDDVVRNGRLEWIQSSAAGMDHCLVPSVVGSDIVVTSASGVLADQVAEHTIALITGLTRSLPVYFRAQQAREYIRRPTTDLTGSTVGIVGFGGNGRRLAEVLHPFKTRILATDYYPIDKPPYVEALWPPERLPELLGESDIVVLAVPLNSVTRGMIDRHALAQMKRGALLVNVARGQVVVEDDLVTALRSGHIAGAGLDVAAEEPLPATSPLWDCPQVIITPHVGGQKKTRIDDMTRFFCENVRRWIAGEPLVNVVDKELGFPKPVTG